MASGYELYSPPDTEAAYEAWGCNCGPTAIAALLQQPCERIRPFLGEFEKRRYMNPTHLLAAFAALGVEAKYAPKEPRPDHGLLFIQWGGPWCAPGVPIARAYRHTHTIAVDGGAAYDVNVGHWVTWEDWTDPKDGVAAWIMGHNPQCDGTWFVRSAIAVPQGVAWPVGLSIARRTSELAEKEPQGVLAL